MTDFAFGDNDGSIEALKGLLAEQDVERRTFGNAKRTKALAMLYAYAVDFQEPQYADLGVRLAHGWAGEEGWATDALTRQIGASKVQMQVQQREEPKQ